MKIILGSRRGHYLARCTIILITVALVAGMVGCEPGPVVRYALTISSTFGGEVTVPGEGVQGPYGAGTEVSLEATPADGYRFLDWTGDVDTIPDVDAAETTITMNGGYAITANFEEIPQYNLTITGTAGGSVITPGEGTLTYDEGTVVILVARADGGHHFVNWSGDVAAIANANAAMTAVTMNDNYSITANFEPGYAPMVAAGGLHTVGLKSDGSVVAVGHTGDGQCDVGGWTDIVQVAAGEEHTVGLKSDGTVVAVGWNSDGQNDVGDWMDMVQVAAGWDHTVGLKSDGTLLALGNNDYGQCDVENWTGIVQVAAGDLHTVGLRFDGTVVAVGLNQDGQCDISGWDLAG